MSLSALGALGPLAKLLTKVLEAIDPETRKRVRKLKALNFAEKFILYFDELRMVADIVPNDGKPQKRNIILKKMRQYRKAFFDYN